MVTCPWCGTNYTSFQPNCDNCGGSLPLPPEMGPSASSATLATPPPPPRDVPRQAVWHILSSDGWAISGLVFALLGLVFLCGGIAILVWRYQMAHRTVELLREGEATLGEIVSVTQNYHVRVNGRYPWTVEYDYEVDGRLYNGKVTTLSMPDLSQQPGSPVYVLYGPDDPDQSTPYPSPYGYYGL